MTTSHSLSLLGCIEGRLLVATTDTEFATHHALQCGEKLVTFQASNQPIENLVANINLLTHGEHVDEPEGPQAGWHLVGDASGARMGQDIGPLWTVEGGHTSFLELAAGVTGQTVRYADRELGCDLPVRAGKPHVAFGHFAAHRQAGQFRVVFVDAAGKALGDKSVRLTNHYRGGKALAGYQAVAIHFTPPAGAVAVRLEIEAVEPVVEPEVANPRGYIFFTHLGLMQTGRHGQPAWVPAPENASGLLRLSGPDLRGLLMEADVDVDAIDKADALVVVKLQGKQKTPVARLSLDDLSQVSARVLPFEGNAISVQVRGYLGRLLVFVDSKLAYTTAAAEGDPANERRERIVVADRFCDGQAHVIEVRDTLGVRILARDVQIFPAALTPWSALQAHSNPPYPFHLSAAASFRYKALLQQLSQLNDAIAAGEAPEDAVQRMATLSSLHRVLEIGFERVNKFPPLHFPKVEHPKVSVIVPAHNKFNVTYFCLAALLFAANKASFEVVVVDDGSEDETLDLPTIAPNVTVARNEVAQGFVRACNLGAAHAKGEYLVLLNNDTEPTVGWLDELLATFDNFDKVGMAGSKLLYPDGRLQEAGGIVWNTGNPWNYGRLANAWDPRFCYARQADYLSGAAVMLPRTVWDEVGGLSDEFAPAYFEDTDLCFKVRDAGYRSYFAPTSVVYHFEGISNGTDVNTTTGLKRYQEINRPKFKRKWAGAVKHNGDEGKNPDLAKDRGIIGRVLFIDYQTPKPDIDAGGYAAVQEMRLVQSLGYKVSFMATNVAYMGRYDDELNRLGIETLYAPFYLSVDQLLEQRGQEFDVVYLTRYYVGRHCIPSIRKHAPQAKILFNNADLHFLRELRNALQSKSQDAMQRALQVRDEELTVMREVNLVLSYNEVEHSVILSHNLSSSKVVKCPWVVETRNAAQVPGFAERQGIAFLGGYGHPPNLEAVEYFVREVMPLLRSRLPGVPFNIYGSNVPKKLLQMQSDDVNIVGYVDTVDEVYDHNRIFVAPLLTGAGIKGKVLGALAHGIPCVLSPVAAESTGVRDGLDCRIADNPEAWAQAIVDLYMQRESWEEMSRQALAFTGSFYSFAKGRELMRKAFEAVDLFPAE